jgi:hypothetical protein
VFKDIVLAFYIQISADYDIHLEYAGCKARLFTAPNARRYGPRLGSSAADCSTRELAIRTCLPLCSLLRIQLPKYQQLVTLKPNQLKESFVHEHITHYTSFVQ